jgi:hypothetical protein
MTAAAVVCDVCGRPIVYTTSGAVELAVMRRDEVAHHRGYVGDLCGGCAPLDAEGRKSRRAAVIASRGKGARAK